VSADSRPFTVLLVAWVLLWLGIGAWTGYEVNGLRRLSTTVVSAGVAVQTTGEALQRFGSIPLVGGDLGRIGGEVRVAGVSAQVSGRASRGTIDTLAVLLGLAVGLIPIGPVVLLVLVLRRLPRR
jgi:hypothetical protein